MIPITITLVKLSAIGSSHVTSRDLARQLNGLLAELGNSEFNQARKALAHAEVSTTPERELTLAIGHLQSADGHFEQACIREINLALNALIPPSERSHSKRSLPSFQMRIACKAAIATIYAQLNQPALVRQYANEIAQIFLPYSESAVGAYSNTMWLSPPISMIYRDGPLAVRAREEAKEAKKFIRALGVELPEGSIKYYVVIHHDGRQFLMSHDALL
jgi:hypothetical protein